MMLDSIQQHHLEKGIQTPTQRFDPFYVSWLDRQLNIHRWLKRSYCLETELVLTLDEPKTIEDLRGELAFPGHRTYNKLRKLEDEGVIEVGRSGTLNTYRPVDS